MRESAAAQGYDLVLKGGRVLDERNGVDGVLDVAITAGKIAAVGPSLAAGAGRVEDVSGCIVAPGLIDIHTHVYHKATSLSVDPGFISRRSATTTLVDAGSAGAGNYDGFRDYVMTNSPYRILAFLNISFPGIFGFDKGVSIGEATLREMLPVDRCVAKIEANRDRIVGVKVRIGGPVTGELGLGALELALRGRRGGRPAADDPYRHGAAELCRRRLDAAAGRHPHPLLSARPELGARRRTATSFPRSGQRANAACCSTSPTAWAPSATRRRRGRSRHGFPPDLISSDVHVIAVEGPGFDLLHTMSKLLNCGLTLPEVIGMSANRPALAIRRPELGHLGVGAPADITVLRQVDSDYVFEDVVGTTRQGSTLLQPVAVYLAGKPMEVGRRPFEEKFILDGFHRHHHH